jgi:hypothetical protein
MTDDPAWVGNVNWTSDWGCWPNEADWLFGVYHRTPGATVDRGVFIADTGAAT